MLLACRARDTTAWTGERMTEESPEKEQMRTYRAGVRFLGTEHPLRSTDRKNGIEELLLRVVGA